MDNWAMSKKSVKTISAKRAVIASEITNNKMIGNGGELHQEDASSVLTTNHGVPLSDNQNSLRAGSRGPTLLEDFALREKIHHFDHERIPERIVHARGSGAGGFFELTKSLSKYSRAKILTEVGAKTEVYARFSTVAGGAGSADTPRDVRGFAVKFYTKEGNWDLVGNNIPVFFIQDAIKFPDLVHAVKMEADRGYPQAASAHDTFWDFISLMPESTHMVMWIMSDRTIPRSLRMIEGFGVHTFRLINDADEATFVKFHWRPKAGLQSTCWDEAVKIAGADSDHHRRDLYESIADGNFPEWEFGVQIISQEQADRLPFDILDATKLVPEEIIPIEIVGRMVLNRNPDNFFAETEQVAFLPTNVPPGIDFSEDPLLQGRLFSYLDTQLSRLGSTNFFQLPVNRAKGCPFQNFQRDGHMQMQVPKGRANYEPNSLGEAHEEGGPRANHEMGFRSFQRETEGEKVRVRADSFADHYSQARLFFRSQSKTEQQHIMQALVFELSKVTLPHIRSRVLANLQNVDAELAEKVATGLGLKELPAPSPAAAPVQDMALAKSLRLLGKYPELPKGRSLGLLVTDGADAKLVASLKTSALKAGVKVVVIASMIEGVILSDGKSMPAAAQLEGAPSVLFDIVAVIASKDGCLELMKKGAAIEFLQHAFRHVKAIGLNAAARPLADKAGLRPDDFVIDLDEVVAPLIERAAQRLWAREAQVRPPL
jgi:catalase